MPTQLDTTLAALALLFSGDTELWQVVGVSFSVSCIALLLVLLPALLLGFALAYLPLPGRWLWLSCINTLQSVPTVVIGLLLGISLLAGFLGLFLTLPVLGHASWHLYRKLVA